MRDYSTCNDVPEGACTLIPSTNSWLDINANEFTTNPTCNTVYSDAVGAVQRTFQTNKDIVGMLKNDCPY